MVSQENNKGYLTSKEVISKTLSYLEILKERGNQILTGVTTGFHLLNKQTTGFNKGDLIIIAARPAMGKTAIALNMILENLEVNNGVIFFSLEMPAEQLMLRLLSAKTSIPLSQLRIGDIDDNQWERVSDAMNELESKTFITDDNTNTTIGGIKTKARRLKMQYPDIKLIVIDYLQLIQSSQNRDRHLEVSEISRGLKTLARELETPIIALSQLNRELEKRVNKRPMISDLRESGSIEQDADIIMFVHREDVYKHLEENRKNQKAAQMGKVVEQIIPIENINEVEAELIIGKQRNGPIGTIKMTFIKNLTKFVESTQEREYNPNIQIPNTQIDVVKQNDEIEIPPTML
jgi:replicative DNA helicase